MSQRALSLKESSTVQSSRTEHPTQFHSSDSVLLIMLENCFPRPHCGPTTSLMQRPCVPCTQNVQRAQPTATLHSATRTTWRWLEYSPRNSWWISSSTTTSAFREGESNSRRSSTAH